MKTHALLFYIIVMTGLVAVPCQLVQMAAVKLENRLPRLARLCDSAYRLAGAVRDFAGENLGVYAAFSAFDRLTEGDDT